MMLLKNDGTPYFYRRSNSHVWDFTKQPSGLISVMDGATAKLMNEHFEIIEKIKCKHGYVTDPHEFIHLPNNHVLLVAEDSQRMDLSAIVDGGRTNAKVVGTHIQEMDANRDVILDWRCWDHYELLDVTHESLKSTTIHMTHMNSIDIDFDGHLIVSTRHQDEIVKINRRTGKVIWRLGGNNNQFTFVNDPDRFSYQHDVRAVPGRPNHYTVMDNGNHHSPQYSRSVEYELDTDKKTAEKVWQYRHSPDRYTNWMGNVQRLDNGNTFICWAYKKLPKVSEVTPTGGIVFEGDFHRSETTYRAHRYDWSGRAKVPYLIIQNGSDKVTLIHNQFGATDIERYYIYADSTEHPTTCIDSTDKPYIELTQLKNYTTYYFRVTSLDSQGVESGYSNEESVNVRFLIPDENLVRNGDFTSNFRYWDLERAVDDLADWEVNDEKQMHVQIYEQGKYPTDVQLYQNNINLADAETYVLSFDARSDVNRAIEVKICDQSGAKDYSEIGYIKLTPENSRYSYEFPMDYASDSNARLAFVLAHSTGHIYLDNIRLVEKVDSNVAASTDESPPFKLEANIPNPFNDTTTLCYSCPQPGRITLSIYDVRGRLVDRIEKKHVPKGRHTCRWKASRLSTGIYFARLTVQPVDGGQAFSDMLKITYIK